MRASGPSGVLRAGYQWAADLGAWEIAPHAAPATFTLRAHVLTQHDYWMQQDSLDVAILLGRVEWLWRGVTVHRDGDTVTVLLTERPIVSERSID